MLRDIVSDGFFRLMRPFRYLVKRWGPEWLKGMAWNSEYARGRHLHEMQRITRSNTCDIVEQYCNKGDILDLGCADGHIGLGLNLKAYNTYTGVDISEIGIKEAFEKCLSFEMERHSRNTFHVHDIASFVPPKPMDVILFKDSLYYITKNDVVKVLNHYKQYLKSNGFFVVQMDNIKRHGWIRDLIRSHFEVMEDIQVDEKDFMTLVFH